MDGHVYDQQYYDWLQMQQQDPSADQGPCFDHGDQTAHGNAIDSTYHGSGDTSGSSRNSKRGRIPLGRRVKRAPRPPLPPPPPAPPARVLNQESLRYLFEKILHKSDVSSLGRIVLPKQGAEEHLPFLKEKEGDWVYMDDMDYIHVWTFKFRFWINNNSKMFVLENTRNFIKEHNLVVGDIIVLFKDDENGSYVVQAKRNGKRAVTHQPTDNNILLKPRPLYTDSQLLEGTTSVATEANMELEKNNVGDVNADPNAKISDELIVSPMCNKDNSRAASYEYVYPVEDFCGGMDQMETFYRPPPRSPKNDFDSINFSLFDP